MLISYPDIRVEISIDYGLRETHLAGSTSETAHLRGVELDHAFGTIEVAATDAVAQRARPVGLGNGLPVSPQPIIFFTPQED